MVGGSSSNRLLAMVFTFAFLLLAIPSLIESSEAEVGAEIGPFSEIMFERQRLYKESDLLYRAAFGDLITGNGHEEMAACSKNGKITITYGSDMTWNTELADQVFFNDNKNDPIDVTSIAIADVIPEREGDELVSVDWAYNVRLIEHDGDGWISEVIYQDEGIDWLYEVAIGEIIQGNNGPEIVVVGESARATLLWRDNGIWKSELMFQDNFPLDTCYISDIDPDVQGNEIIVGGIDKNLTLISGSPGNWSSRDIAFLGSSIIDVLAADIDPTVPGVEIYASTFSGYLYQIKHEGNSFIKTMIFDEGAMIYGIEAGIIEGIPIISMATWNSRLAILYFDLGFKTMELFREEFYLIGTGIHDIDPYHEGDEIFGLSALGYLTMVYHDAPGIEIILPFNHTRVSLNEKLELPFLVKFKGGYDGDAVIQITHDTEGGAIPPIPNVSEPGIYTHTFVFGQSSQTEFEFRVLNLPDIEPVPFSVEVVDDDLPVGFSTPNITGSVGVDRQLTNIFQVTSKNDVGTPFILTPSRMPTGLDLELDMDFVDPLGYPVTVGSTIRVQPDANIMFHYFFLLGSTSDNRIRAIGYSIEVLEISVMDFQVLVQGPSLEIKKGENATFDLLIVPLNDFSGTVTLSLVDPMDDLIVTFSEINVFPPQTVTVRVELLEDDGPYFIELQGSSGGLVRSDTMRIETLPPRIYLEIEGPEGPVYMEKKDGLHTSEFTLNITPVNGIIEGLHLEIEGSTEGYSVSISPTSIERVPYEIELKVMIEGPDDITMNELTLNFSSEDGSWTVDIIFLYDDVDPDKNEIDPTWLIIIAFLSIMGIAAFLVFRSRQGNVLNQDDRVEETDAIRDRRSAIDADRKRSHSFRSGLDRMERDRR